MCLVLSFPSKTRCKSNQPETKLLMWNVIRFEKQNLSRRCLGKYKMNGIFCGQADRKGWPHPLLTVSFSWFFGVSLTLDYDYVFLNGFSTTKKSLLKRTLQNCTHINATTSKLSWAEAQTETLRTPQNAPVQTVSWPHNPHIAGRSLALA